MSIESAITTGFNAVANSVRSLRSLVTGSAKGDLSGLITADKTSIIAAINEVKGRVGFKYTFTLANQPRRTWIQPTVLTEVYNNAGALVTMSSGTFTFKPASTPGVVRTWVFLLESSANTYEGASVGAEIRVNGASMARATIGGVEVGMGAFPTSQAVLTYRINGGEAITFHTMHSFSVLLGILGSTNSNYTGRLTGIAL